MVALTGQKGNVVLCQLTSMSDPGTKFKTKEMTPVGFVDPVDPKLITPWP